MDNVPSTNNNQVKIRLGCSLEVYRGFAVREPCGTVGRRNKCPFMFRKSPVGNMREQQVSKVVYVERSVKRYFHFRASRVWPVGGKDDSKVAIVIRWFFVVQVDLRMEPAGLPIRSIMVMKVAVLRFPRALARAAWDGPLKPSDVGIGQR